MRTVTLAALALLVSSPAWSQADGDEGAPAASVDGAALSDGAVAAADEGSGEVSPAASADGAAGSDGAEASADEGAGEADPAPSADAPSADAPSADAPSADAPAGDGSDAFVFEEDSSFDDVPPEDVIPAYRPEVVVVPVRADASDGLANLAYGGEAAGFEGAVRAGHEAYEGVPGGFRFGAHAMRLGTAIADEDGSGARKRPVWARTTVEVTLAADVGVDAFHVEVAPWGRRDERSANDVRTALWAPVSVSRLRVHGRQLDAAASVVALEGAWRVDAQRGAVAIETAAQGPGLRFIDYTDDHTFFGARLFSAAAELVPEFPLQHVTLHYVAGGHVDFAAGARDGGLFVSHNDFDVHTGAGATFLDRVHLRSTLGYRAARDTRRDTVAGWVVRTDVTVRFP